MFYHIFRNILKSLSDGPFENFYVGRYHSSIYVKKSCTYFPYWYLHCYNKYQVMSLASSGTILSVYEQNWIIMAKDLESPYKTPFGIKEIKQINNRDTVRKTLLVHARQKFEEIPCFSVANKDQLTTCRCLECFLEDKELVEQLLDLLQEYAYLSLDAHCLFLHGIVTNAFLQKEFNSKGEKRIPTFLLNGVSSDSFLQTYLCMNAFR